jgi:hypothetical protein
MKVIYNTLDFIPIFRGNITTQIADIRGSIIIEEDEDLIVCGGEIIDQIQDNPDKDYLVSELAFKYLKYHGVGNICMLDESTKDDDLTYGGVITP